MSRQWRQNRNKTVGPLQESKVWLMLVCMQSACGEERGRRGVMAWQPVQRQHLGWLWFGWCSQQEDQPEAPRGSIQARSSPGTRPSSLSLEHMGLPLPVLRTPGISSTPFSSPVSDPAITLISVSTGRSSKRHLPTSKTVMWAVRMRQREMHTDHREMVTQDNLVATAVELF